MDLMYTKNQTHQFDELWCIAEKAFALDSNKHFEGIFTQGNGYMNVRGSFEEGLRGTAQDEEYMRMPANVTLEQPRHPITKWGTFIPGIAGKHPLLKEEIINLPYFLDMKLSIADEAMDMEHSSIKEYKRWLDLRDGSLYRSFIWEAEIGLELRLQYKRFISMADKHLCLQQLQVEVLSGEGLLDISCGINPKVRTNGYNHFKEVLTWDNDSGSICTETITDGGNRVLMQCGITASEEMSWSRLTKDKRIFFQGRKALKAGDSLVITKVTAVVTDRDIEEGSLQQRGQQQLELFFREGWGNIYERHWEAWSKKWASSDIRITGDDYAQLAVRTSVYHLIRSNCEEDSRVAICAKGYAGEAYFGHYFWDTEINMLPFFIHTNPQGAKNLLMYRYNTLEGARKNAREYGYKGARYAWESSLTGEEQCPCWQYADHEIHITADIVYAICHYVKATGDADFISDFGIDIMVETARYWTERVDRNEDGSYELLGVMGPDEYLPMTRNNSFTNRMVKFSLDKTVEFLLKIRQEDIRKFIEIEKRLDLKANEIGIFKAVGEKLVLPYDQNSKVIPQSEDFESYADLDFDDIWTDRTKPFGNFISQERNYRSKALKQADVLEMIMLYPEDFTREQLINAYDYYEPITTHDSSLSASVHGLLAARMGRMEEAERFFKKVMAIDMSLVKKGAAEGMHIANCGGLWQFIVYGFAGLKSAMWSGEIVLEPHLPENWVKLEFTIEWHGKQYGIAITKDKQEIFRLYP